VIERAAGRGEHARYESSVFRGVLWGMKSSAAAAAAVVAQRVDIAADDDVY